LVSVFEYLQTNSFHLMPNIVYYIFIQIFKYICIVIKYKTQCSIALQIDQSRLVKLASAVDAETENISRNILDAFSKAKEQFETKIPMC
jgi:hypothetical protein